MDYFSKYTQDEVKIIKLWIEKYSPQILSLHSAKVIKDNTPYHDAYILLEDKGKIFIEVKQEEMSWFCKTGNIGIDYISAFKYKDQAMKDRVVRNKYWVSPKELPEFMKSIEVKKWGKLVTCDAHLQIFYVESKRKSPLFLEALNNIKLKELRKYIEKTYSLRINDKSKYSSSSDTWESAAYFINLNKDSKIASIVVNNEQSFEELLLLVSQ